jgi:hypothetical protein
VSEGESGGQEADGERSWHTGLTRQTQ